MLVMACIALGVGVVTLVLAMLIQSVTKDTLDLINAIVKTLPGANDIERVQEDIRRTGETRGKVVFDAPGITHVAWELNSPVPLVSRARRIKRRFWGGVRRVANWIF